MRSFNICKAKIIIITILVSVILTPYIVLGESCTVKNEDKLESMSDGGRTSHAEMPKERQVDAPEMSSVHTADEDKFSIDNDWVAIDLGAFVPHFINNSTQIAGDILADKGGPFAGIWKQGFVEKLDGPIVTTHSSAIAVNDSGQVVGFQKGRYGDFNERAVIWNNGILQELGTFGGTESRALAINNSGEVVGWATEWRGFKQAFIWRNGTMQVLGTLDSGVAINSTGQVVGTVGEDMAILWNNGMIQNLEKPGDQLFTAVGAKQIFDFNTVREKITSTKTKKTKVIVDSPVLCLNDAGQVAGYLGQQAFLWGNGVFQELTTDKGAFIPLGINKLGTISGKVNDRAAVWHNGVVIELNNYFKSLRKWPITEARGINDYGQIIVYATDMFSGLSKSFLVTPTTGIPVLIAGTNKERSITKRQ